MQTNIILKNRQKIKKLEREVYKTEKELAKEILTKKDIRKGDRVYIKPWKKYGYFEKIYDITIKKNKKVIVYLIINEVTISGKRNKDLDYEPVKIKDIKKCTKKFTKKHATNYKRTRSCDCIGWCSCRE